MEAIFHEKVFSIDSQDMDDLSIMKCCFLFSARRVSVCPALPQLPAAGPVLLGRGPGRPRQRAGHHGETEDGGGWGGHSGVPTVHAG